MTETAFARPAAVGVELYLLQRRIDHASEIVAAKRRTGFKRLLQALGAATDLGDIDARHVGVGRKTQAYGPGKLVVPQQFLGVSDVEIVRIHERYFENVVSDPRRGF